MNKLKWLKLTKLNKAKQKKIIKNQIKKKNHTNQKQNKSKQKIKIKQKQQ